MEPLDELLAVIASLHAGDRDGARDRLTALSLSLPAADHTARCVLAHYLADAQDDPTDELHWDEVALAEAALADPIDVETRIPGATLASFVPSLHLNLAASYERLGDRLRARKHADLASQASANLPDTPLGQLTRDAISRIRRRLNAPDV